MFIWVALKENVCHISKDNVDNYTSMFESMISAGAKEKFTRNKSHFHGPAMWKVMQRNAWNDIANWRKNNSTSVQSRNSMP